MDVSRTSKAQPAVTVRDLHKVYGDLAAVDGVSFTIDHGEVFALLGPNGAGKTTAVEILEGHRRRTSGSVEVLGSDPQDGGRAFRERIGIVLQDAGFDEDFTVRELVELYRGMYPRRLDTDGLIDQVGLSDKTDTRVRNLSGGQRRRLDLALGLVGDPDLIFLDEPTTGFDPVARRHAWTLIEGLRDAGKTVLLTTHYLDEAEHLADRVAIMVEGRLVAMGTPAEIGAGQRDAVLSFRLPDGVDIAGLPRLDAPPVAAGVDWQLTTTHPTAALHTLTGWALEHGVELSALTVRRPTLEDAYLALIAGGGDTSPGSPVPVVAVHATESRS
ncbi:MAG: ABC transporter ATP-binding protein [Knoellia sp.]